MKTMIADKVVQITTEPLELGGIGERYEKLLKKIDEFGFERPTYTLPMVDTIGVRAHITGLKSSSGQFV